MPRSISKVLVTTSLMLGLTIVSPSVSLGVAKGAQKPAAKKPVVKKKLRTPAPTPATNTPTPKPAPTQVAIPAPAPKPQPAPVVAPPKPAPAPTPSGPPGSLHIVTIPGAEVVIGNLRFPASQTISDLNPGEYEIQVVAPDFPVQKKTVVIESNKTLTLQVDFKTGKSLVSGLGTLRLIKPPGVSGVHYIIDGRNYDGMESQLASPGGLKFPAAEKVTFVAYNAAGRMEQTFPLRAGEIHDLTLKLENTGKLFIDSHPNKAKVLIDNKEVGFTPLYLDKVEAGPHEITVDKDGYQAQHVKVTIDPTTNKVQNLTDIVLEAEDIAASDDVGEILRSYSSFSAVTPPAGRGSFDFGSGWPHVGNLRLLLGVYKKEDKGVALGLEFRTNGYMNTLGALVKFQFGDIGPTSFGLDLYGGGGGGPRNRVTGSFELGAPITFSSANGRIRFTLRPYLEVYSDQNCPTEAQLLRYMEENPDPGTRDAYLNPRNPAQRFESINDRCYGLDNFGVQNGDRSGPNPMAAAANFNNPNPSYRYKAGDIIPPGYQVGDVRDEYRLQGTPILGQFIGVRFFIQLALEVQFSRRFGMYATLDWTPFQNERHAYTEKFNRIAPVSDTLGAAGALYGRVGFSVKF